MMENIDILLFRAVNSGLSCGFLDKLMPLITNVNNWLLVYIFLFGWLFWKGGREGRILGAVLIATIIISDQLNSTVFKDLFDRLRPCRTLDDINLLVDCGKGRSFPSSHAVNNFAAAVVLSEHFKKYKHLYLSIAFLVSFSRVYVGVHYPFDVFAGAIVGITIGLLMSIVFRFLLELKLKTPIRKQLNS